MQVNVPSSILSGRGVTSTSSIPVPVSSASGQSSVQVTENPGSGTALKQAYIFDLEFGSMESGKGQFQGRCGIALDPSGNIFVVDGDNSRVEKFSSNGTFIRQFGSEGEIKGQFFWPRGIAADLEGLVYVADTTNHRIQKYTNDGVFLKVWEYADQHQANLMYHTVLPQINPEKSM